MQRRDFITFLDAAAAVWPLAAGAQQAQRAYGQAFKLEIPAKLLAPADEVIE